ncbi:MAG TPA: DUF6064 family protein [Ramlibacter sp.]|nr:DUF6064 family protein [Ramlibacter sp.]
MTEWWTYRLSSFLMFSPRTYWRLVESYNRDIWPAPVVAAGAGLVLLWLTAVPRPGGGRIVAAILAVAWLWVGWAFHWQRYATINWAAGYFAVAFWLQAALLVIAGVFRSSDPERVPRARVRNVGLTLAVCGLLLYPLAGLPAGRPWAQAEVFGVMPEPTAMVTLGLLLATGQSHTRWLSIVPVLSLAVGMATLWLISS